MRTKQIIRVLAASSVGLFASIWVAPACASGATQCQVHCWEYTVPAAAQACTDQLGASLPIPLTGANGYFGRFCKPGQGANEATALATAVVEDGNDIGTELGTDFVSNWGEVADFMHADINARCLATAPPACSSATAKSACENVADLGRARLLSQLDFVVYGGQDVFTLGALEECTFAPIFFGLADTDGMGEGGVDDGTFWASDGADDTAGPPAEPFGDVGRLIDCSPQTDCDVDRELLFNVQQWMGVFYDEGVSLSLVDATTTCGPGAQISGLDVGEHAHELAQEFDLRNGDIIASVNSTALSSQAKALDVVEILVNDDLSSTTIVIERRQGGTCATLTYTIDVI